MKVAIVTFHNDKHESKVGGITTGPFYMRDILSKVAVDRDIDLHIDIIALTKKHKSSCDGVLFLTDHHDLEKYDFVIFKTPGYQLEKFDESQADTRYDWILNDINIPPFAFIVNEERDKEIFPYYKNFCDHPKCAFILFNSIGMHEDFQEFYETCGKYIEFNYAIFNSSKDEVLDKAMNKESKVLTSTARWVPRKRVQELAGISPRLVDKGFTVKIFGAAQSYFTAVKILETNPDSWENHGYYAPEDVETILQDAKYHYNFVFLKRKTKNRVMRPRLEISTFEALNAGCLPVICSDTSPEWIKDAEEQGLPNAICINSSDLERLPEILEGIENDNSRLLRISNFYDAAYENTILDYHNILMSIQEVMNNGR